ncbi:uncharacterized protein [Nicotiana tomentosiformis]|uniref:uncharacterized protein n=1 Tax=Nicotiana tomentosiformis TaxID=4098 RepID=UPI00388C792E
MTGIPPEVMTHKLNEDPSYPPVKQNKRKQGSFKHQLIHDEVQKLLKIGSIREVKYLYVLANTVVVPKKNGKWQVCLDYTDLNKACPKDLFPLPHIDQLINSTAGHEMFSFLDAYTGYNQINMDPLDEVKTSFITYSGTYCYKVMPFALKNVGATYQRLVLANFVADFSTNLVPEVEKKLQVFTGSNSGTWILFTDGSSNVKGAGLGIVLIPLSGEIIRQAIKCYPITNNEAEYEAVIAGLKLARELGIEQIVIKSDSQLVVNLMQGTYIEREARMQQYLEKAWELVRQFQSWKVVQIPREENGKANALANLASVAEITNAENDIVIHLFHSVLDQDKNEKRLEESKGKWPKVLQGVLWAYRTTTKTSTDETQFLLVYGTEALIPVEIGEPSTRYTHATEVLNEEEMRTNLNLLEERREAPLIRMAAQKHMIERYYNKKANMRYFKIGDFVLKKVFQSTKAANAGKLSPNLEGPYRVLSIIGK